MNNEKNNKAVYTSPRITTIEIEVEMGFTASLFEGAEKAGVSEASYNISLLKRLMAAKP